MEDKEEMPIESKIIALIVKNRAESDTNWIDKSFKEIKVLIEERDKIIVTKTGFEGYVGGLLAAKNRLDNLSESISDAIDDMEKDFGVDLKKLKDAIT